MAIKTDEDLLKVFNPIIEEVVEAITERAEKLLIQHINTDVYGINKTETGKPTINQNYLDGTGTPSYEFRDVAWDKKTFKQAMSTYVCSVFYDGSKLSSPSQSSPYLHGNYYDNINRKDELADILNVSGIAPNGDFRTNKVRNVYWDNFIKEFKEKIGSWLYTEFNNRGIKIPDIKSFNTGNEL